MNRNEALDLILEAGHLDGAAITLDGAFFLGATENPLLVLGVLCCREGGATLEQLAVLTGLDPDTFGLERPMPNLSEDELHIALGKLVRIWLAIAHNDLAEALGLVGREALPGIVPAALAEALKRIAPARIAPAKVAA